jgi:hypothetical protein
MIITGPIESFFKPPKITPSDEGDCILFHLRRDLEKLYGNEDEFDSNSHPQIMLSIMGILAGIDYLSQVYSSAKRSRDRFVQTLKELCKISDEDSEAIYQLRCALMHSVSLSTISRSFRKGTRFNFEITDNASFSLVLKLFDNNSEVSLRVGFWELKRTFKSIISILEGIAKNPNDPKNSLIVNRIGQMHAEKILKK